MTPNIEKKLRNTQWELNDSCGALFETSCQSSIVLGHSRALIKQRHARSLASNMKCTSNFGCIECVLHTDEHNEGSFAIVPTIYH